MSRFEMREMRELHDAISLSSQQDGGCCSLTRCIQPWLCGALKARVGCGMWDVKACSIDLRYHEE